MNWILSLLPIAVYILILKMLDSFSLARWKTLLAGIGYGALCCGALWYLVSSVLPLGSATPLVEELLKGGFAAYLICSKRIRFMPEALIYGAAAGAGFSLVENIIYLYSQPGMMAGTAIVRGFGCAILHMGCSALMATLLIILFKSRLHLVSSITISFIPSVLIHYAYNLSQENSLAQPMALMAIAVVLLLALFVLLFSYGDKMIFRWMDHSINVDIQTLSAIRSGHFSSTRAGQYLLEVKDQFKPECFFDMICYVQLFLELKIEKQSYMLLCQAGFDGEAMGKTLGEHQAKKAELKSLKKSIGLTGMHVLSPLVSE